MKKVLTLFMTLIATCTLWAGNVITYTSAYKLREGDDLIVKGTDIHTKGFDVDIANHTFSNGVGTITFVSDITSIPTHMFYYSYYITSVTIPEGVTSIDSRAFQFCSNLTTVNLPSTLTTIGFFAFSDCPNLTNITIPESVTTIGDHAFYNCEKLSNITLPESLTTIADGAFSGCSLTEVTIPQNVTSIGLGAFSLRTGLTSIVVDSNNSIYDSRNNCNAIIYTATDSLIKGCQNSFIPEGITRIGRGAFGGCTNLTSIDIPNSITSIGDYAFNSCNGLTYIDIPNSVIEIGEGAFNNTGLTSITIPESVTSIGLYAFDDCAALSSITCLAETPPTIPVKKYSSDAYFKNIDRDIPVYIPCGSIRRYQNANGWSVFTNFQQPEICLLDITVTSEDTTMGSVTGSDSIQYLETAVISATANYGYHFARWNDGVTDNPREVVIECDTAFSALFIKNTYNLSVSTELIDGIVPGRVSGAGTVYYLNTKQISATPNYGYHFAQWSDGVTDNPRNVVVTQNSSFVAQFAKNTYSVVVSGENGIEEGSGDYLYLETITISASPNIGFQFAKWNDGNTDNPRQVVVRGNATYTAQFGIKQCVLTLGTNNDAWGLVSGDGVYDYKKIVSCTAMAMPGYKFVKWSDGSTNNPHLFEITDDITVVAEFAEITYSVTTSPNYIERGITTGDTTAHKNDVLSVSAIPAYGYYFSQWSDGNTDNPRNFTLTKDESLTAVFEKNSYSIALSAELVDGAEAGSVAGDGTFLYLDDTQIYAIANYGYHFTQWTDGVITNPRPITVSQDSAFIAQFAKNSYTISAFGTNGTVEGTGIYSYLDTVTLMAISDPNYHFVQWTDGVLDNPRSFAATENMSFEAVFAGDMFTISASATNGTITGAGTYIYLSTIELFAQADYGYHFSHWSDGNTYNPRMLTVSSDSAFTAIFEKNQYALTLTSSNDSHGKTTGDGTYLYQDEATISAVPSTGFQFNQWSDGNTDNPRQVIIASDTTFTAEFGIKQCELIITVNNDAWGIVKGDGVYDYKTAVTCTAAAMSGYEFVKWSDGSTYNPYQFVIFDNMELMAEFAEIGQGIYQTKLDKAPEKLVVDGILYIRRGDSLYDAQGRMLK